ncbi:MAG: pyridoxal-phosphate dependent enzyme [Lachnospiraceae bacterium]|nr:pyridoxal-phosphate dependent enzyme [Lachnospiraceae bacterium]
MKRVMILGASYSQTPLYESARKLGYYTIAASIPGDYPGFSLADESVYVNIADPEAVTQAAKACKADGIATCSLDLGMGALGAACEALSLPGPSRESAHRASNKLEMKKALTAAGVQTAQFLCIHNEKELEEGMKKLSFPVILKAVDQMGSRGIFRCDTPEEVRENYPRTMAATGKEYCLLEEFIIGEIFGVEAMIEHGKILYMLPNNIEAFVSTTPTPVGHSVPYKKIEQLGGQIREQTEKAIRSLGLDNCPVNCDFIRRGDQVYVIELTGRSGATGLSEMVSIYYGIEYYDCIVKLAMGEPVAPYFEENQSAVPNLTHTLTADRAGILQKIHNYNTMDEDILDLSFNIVPGDEVKPYTNGRDRIGQVILKGSTLPECEEKLRRILGGIHLELVGDIPLFETPIHPVSPREDNEIYMKREDMLPFSFGGNKVRFAQYFLSDCERQGADAMIIYGGYHSNLCRILSAACKRKHIPCSMIHNVDDVDQESKSCNAGLIHAMDVKEYPCHKGSDIARAVQQAMDDLKAEGHKPYYIYGNTLGSGNEQVPMQAYVDTYQEICAYEQRENQKFDYIFLATSTNATQSGLVMGQLLAGDERNIVGISVTRSARRASQVILSNLQHYAAYHQLNLPEHAQTAIQVSEDALAGGYGQFDEKIRQVIREEYQWDGVNLDGVYTGKAFYGMLQYLRKNQIHGKRILFLHTGGAPLFFDQIETVFS